MQAETIAEARRQIEICNACRYCEGYCAVFPAIARQRSFSDGDVTQLANLCHNCRGCHYACQYAEPHVFAVNLPAILAEARQESWRDHAWPAGFARAFERSGTAIAVSLVISLAAFIWVARSLAPAGGVGFYAVISHATMVAIFLPAFLLPLAAVAVSLRRYWSAVGGTALDWRDLARAGHSAGRLDNLSGGQGQGCNFEKEDRFTNARRWLHQAVLAGFLLCFASTSAGTILHYGFDSPAPYGPLSLPKLFGVPGGLLLCIGTLGLALLKLKADQALGLARAWGGEMAFVMLLFLVSASGLALYAATGTAAVPALLVLHLAAVLTFFVLTPYSKMAHGFYRFAALVREAQSRRRD